jgi:hypothetical protein
MVGRKDAPGAGPARDLRNELQKRRSTSETGLRSPKASESHVEMSALGIAGWVVSGFA